MSKTRKRVLSVLAILFAAALVFTACLALTGCGDSDDGGTTWPADWTEYKFTGTSTSNIVTDEDPLYLYIWSDGTFWVGTDSYFEMRSSGAGTNGWWGYFEDELTFVKNNGSGDYAYSICEMTTSGSSVTIGLTSGMFGTCTATISDVGCLAGNTGYDFSSMLVEGAYDTITGVLTA